MTISGIGKKSGLGTMTSAENVTATCDKCTSVTHYMPTKKGQPGTKGAFGTTLCAPGSGSCAIGDTYKSRDGSQLGHATTKCSGGAGYCQAVVDAHWDPSTHKMITD